MSRNSKTLILFLLLIFGGVIYHSYIDFQHAKSCNVLIEGISKYGYCICSGVVISEDGLILMAGHCVKEARAIQITLSNGNSYVLTRWYIDSNDDVAFLQIPDVNNLSYAKFGDSDKLKKGDNVYGIGEYDGIWDNKICYGEIHKIHFKRLVLDVDSEFIFVVGDSAAGCSGGGVYKGSRLIGIMVMRTDGVYFAVPINVIKRVLEKYKDWSFLPSMDEEAKGF